MTWPYSATSCWVYPLAIMDGSSGRRLVEIEQLSLSTRATNALLSEGIDTIDKLLRLNRVDVTGIRGLGAHSYREVLDCLKRAGIDIPPSWPRRIRCHRQDEIK